MKLVQKTKHQRCAYCHDNLDGSLCECGGSHLDCRAANGNCPVCNQCDDSLDHLIANELRRMGGHPACAICRRHGLIYDELTGWCNSCAIQDRYGWADEYRYLRSEKEYRERLARMRRDFSLFVLFCLCVMLLAIILRNIF